MSSRPPILEWPYLNYDRPHAQGMVFGGFAPHPGGWDFHDCSLQPKNGRLTNMTPATAWQWSEELVRQAVAHDGLDDRIVGSLLPGIDISRPCSAAIWFRTNSTTAEQQIMEHQVSLNNRPVTISLNRTAGRVYVMTYTGVFRAKWASYGDTEWHHVAMTWDGSSVVRGWLDGVEMTNDSELGFSGPPEGFFIGQQTAFPAFDRPLNGRISDAVLYRRIITPTEIATLADRSDPFLDGLIRIPGRRNFISLATGNWSWLHHLTTSPYGIAK